MWLALWEIASFLYIFPSFYRLYFGGYSIFMIARSIDPALLPSDNKSTMGAGLAVAATPGSPSDVARTKVLLPRPFWTAFGLSCVYGRSFLTGYLTNVINTTFSGAAGDTLASRVHLHAVPESCLWLPSGTVTGIAPIGLTRRARLPLVCATTLGVLRGDLQLKCGAVRLALCRLSNDPWWCRWAA